MNEDDLRSRRRSDMRELLDSWPAVPAFLCDRHLTVIVSNRAARAVSPSFAEGVNLVRFTFLDPEVRHTAPGWSEASDQVTAMLRDSLDQHDEDRSFRNLVGELSAMSPEFAEAWADERRPDSTGLARFGPPGVAALSLTYHLLRVPEDYEDILFVWRASDGESHQALMRLLAR